MMMNKLPCLGPALGALALLGAATIAIAGPYGALATSPDAAYGFSYDYDDMDAATARAMTECGGVSSQCSVKATFQNTCVSLAKASNGAMGWAWGRDRAENDRRALAECTKSNGDNCSLIEQFCTGDTG